MSEYKHTPGEWLVATSCSWRRIVNGHGEPVCVPITQRSDNHPDLYFPNGGWYGPDARLICAAPEMLEALTAFVSNSSIQTNYPDECEIAEKALARATGATDE
tara:strand:+ start:8029 stop:8337 length:309 start_codon:yes stop_codon:yes gene_type:complete